MVAANLKQNGKTANKTEAVLPSEIGTDPTFKREIVWFNAIGFLILHLAALYGYYLCFKAHWLTNIWMFLLTLVSGLSVTIGAHRLYSHKAFKAKFLLRLLLVTIQTISGQNCLYIWVRDHRQHHKYSDTDADPHNANRGFFFSHIGWLMSKKHPLVIEKGKTIDMSDLEADPLVVFQKNYYKPLYMVFAIAIPIAIPVYFWGESYTNSFFISYLGRYIIQLNFTWLINSATHLYGIKPYDKFINPVENAFISSIALGEGWHNYHHSFPWDYRAAEFGLRYSLSTRMIDFFSFLGLAYDLRSASPEIVKAKSLKRGDGTHHLYGKMSQNITKVDNLLEEFRDNMDLSENQIMQRNIASQG